jgi:3-dehydroquinate synthase
MKIRVRTGKSAGSYTIEIRPGILGGAGQILKARLSDDRIFVLTNDRVGPLYYKALRDSLRDSGFDPALITIPDGERYKTHGTYRRIIDRLVSLRADRQSSLAALGGGVAGDIGGLVAATYMRGITLVHIPTTLVAQIDSSIGGKVAIDHQDAKNLVGTFYNPRMVLTDPEVLKTLRKRDFLSGLFEAIKVGLVCRAGLFRMIADNIESISAMEPDLLRQLIVRSAREKVRIVERDPFDRGRRAILNFGHTVGHALETGRRYRSISHGEAVGLGMLVALRLSISMGYMTERRAERAYGLILSLLRPGRLRSVDPEDLWRTIGLDKKRKGGGARFILLRDIGKPFIVEVGKSTFLKVLREI